MARVGAGERWGQTLTGGQQFQIQADTECRSPRAVWEHRDSSSFRNILPEKGTCEPRQEGLRKGGSQSETRRWEQPAQFGEEHAVQSCWNCKYDLGWAGPGHAQALMPGPGSSLCPWGAGEPWENTKQGGTGQLRGPAGMDGRGKPGNWEVGEEDGMRVQGERVGPGPEL